MDLKKKNSGNDDGKLTLIGKMMSSTDVGSRNSKKRYLLGKLFGPYSFINISEGRDEVDYVGLVSRRNMMEVAVVMNILQRLHKEWQWKTEKLSVCVVSPYTAQIKEMGRRLKKSYEKLHNFVVKVESVEGFQDSGEADIVIISTVRSNSVGSVEFVFDHQKTKFSMTKARHCLWILGNGKTLVEANSVWKDIVSDAKDCKCYFDAEEDYEIAQVIIDVKSKLDELEDLLDKQSIIFKAARWKVTFSEMFYKSFSNLPSLYAKKLVLKLLLNLANGWRPKKKKTNVYCDTSSKIAKQFKVQDWYIICTNDISRLPGYATQILKVWDILHLRDVPTLVNRIDKIYGAFSDKFLVCCKEKCLEGNLEIPRVYPSFDAARYKCNTSGRKYVENMKVKESLLLMKFYSLSASVVSQLLTASDGMVLNVPFEISDEERDIVLDQRSTFVLGRSGTGKTTVLVMKLFQKEQQHKMASEGFSAQYDLIFDKPCRNDSFLPQLFVTVNPKLCLAVKEHINNFRRFVRGDDFDTRCIPIDGADMDEQEKFKDIPDSFEEIPSHAYPLVITFNMFLLMLDKSLGSSYFDRFPDIRKICSMKTSSGIVAQALRKKEVTYDKFRTSYWLHFNSKFTSNLDPISVFTEINSCIKGRLHFEEGECSKLSLQSYLQLSNSRFSKVEREMVYRIFEDYEKKKAVRGEYDLSDLVNDLHQRLKCQKYEGEFMDFVYIDEVQDLTMKQLALFKYISNNVEEGFVFAGDTAQTIAKGVDFRFEDIKCLFYKEFLHGMETGGKKRMHDKGIVSPISHLSQNFRTHAGIVNLAQSVIELIYYFFPDSIDKLNPETSLLCGELPTLLDFGTHEVEDAIIEIFQDKENLSENGIRFGAEQVIMVRDDSARDKVANSIGKNALVLTILECKGLEFEDVLLYNFFGSSPLKEQWRVIYECMEKKHCLLSPENFPEFTCARHDILCYELKQLYVAITRTRQRLWICEDIDGFSSPMAYFWQKLNLIQLKKLDDSFMRSMQVASSLGDWRLRGMKMLEVYNYKAAIQCFEHAKDFHWVQFARASALRAAADNLRGSSLLTSLEMLREAAELFESIEKPIKAAECYFDAEEYEKAGELYRAESDLQRAGECFMLGRCYDLAAEVFARGYYFRECLYACLKGELFHLGLRYIKNWKQQKNLSKSNNTSWIDLNASEQKFLHKCALASHKQQDKQAMMKYVKNFHSLESKRKFLKKLGCFDELIEVEVENGNLREAAKSARQIGNILREADLLEQAGSCDDACQLYLAFVFASSLWADGSKGWPLKDFPSKNGLLSKAKALAHKYSPDLRKDVCENIQFLSGEKFDFQELEKQLALSVKNNYLRGKILSTRRILDMLLATNVSMYSWEIDVTNLIYYWNYWKEKIGTMLKCLDSILSNKNGSDSVKVKETDVFPDHYREFCLEHLGVRKRSDSPDSDYCLLYPSAEWVKYVPGRSNLMKSIRDHQLVYAAKGYWCAEILSVGMNLLKLLESFRISSDKKTMPVCSKQAHIHIFEAAQFLLAQCRFLMRSNDDAFASLMKYIYGSAKEYFCHIFSLDCGNKRLLFSEGLAMQINTSRDLLKEATLQRFMVEVANVKEASSIFQQVIQVAVMLLGSSCQTNEKHKEITSKCNMDSPWNSLMTDLLTYTTGLQTSHYTMKLVQSLRDALSEAYYLSYDISPSCFVYLLDRLLVMVSCSKGRLYATRSSCTEWLVHLNWNVNKETFAFNGAEPELSSYVDPIYSFLAYTIHELLVNSQETEDWVKKAGPNLKKNLSLLTLKLLVLMCLICVNSGKHLQLLNDVLDSSDFISLVPSSFMEVLYKQDGCIFVNVLAKALQRIDDPLVVIRNPDVCPMVYARRAIPVKVFNKCPDDILEKMYAFHRRN